MDEIITVTVYLDSDYRCHAEAADGLTPYATEFFVGCEDLIPRYRIVPHGESWTRADGAVFYGEMITPI